MKKYFITGLALLLPAVFTVMIFLFVLNILTKPFVGTIEHALNYFDMLDTPILFFTAKQVITFFSRVIILILLFLTTVLIGLLTRILVFHYLIRLGNYILHKIPFINKIYKAAQDVIETIFKDKATTFSQVVLIPFPEQSNLCLGLITNAPETDEPITDNHGNISVFVPATPNPTMGFMLLYKREQLIFLDMTVDEAIQFIVSCGVMCDEIKVKSD
ncbi:MAG: DUF502 domain-containing protein [Chlamydiota bacterium]